VKLEFNDDLFASRRYLIFQFYRTYAYKVLFKYEKLEAVDDESEKIKTFSIFSVISGIKYPHSVLRIN
jgi:hypothetical protein